MGVGILHPFLKKMYLGLGVEYILPTFASEDNADADMCDSYKPIKGRFSCFDPPSPLPLLVLSVPRRTLSIVSAKGACPEGS